MAELSPTDLFPPEGHLYLTKYEISELRKKAMAVTADGETTVEVDARVLLQLICDWKNLQPDFEELPFVPEHDHKWQDSGFATVEDCAFPECRAVRSRPETTND